MHCARLQDCHTELFKERGKWQLPRVHSLHLLHSQPRWRQWDMWVILCHTLSHTVISCHTLSHLFTLSNPVTHYHSVYTLLKSVTLCHTLSHSVAAYDVALAGSQTESTNVLFYLGSGPDDDVNNLRATGVDSLLKCYRLCLMINSGNCLIFRWVFTPSMYSFPCHGSSM